MVLEPMHEEEQPGKKEPLSSDGLMSAFMLTFVIGLGVFLIFMFQQSYPAFIGPFSNIVTPVFAFAALVSCSIAVQKYGFGLRRNLFGQSWFYITVGMLCWFLGEVSWGIYNFVLDVSVPYPSVADVFYVAGYLPLFLGFFFYIKPFVSGLPKRRIAQVLAIISVSSVLTLFFLLKPVLMDKGDVATKIFDLAYPILDLVLLTLAVLGFVIFMGGKIAKSWMLLSAAIVLNVIGDIGFSFQTLQGTYYNGSFDDVLFLWGYMMFALASYSHTREI